jgi:hypothetical protein
MGLIKFVKSLAPSAKNLKSGNVINLGVKGAMQRGDPFVAGMTRGYKLSHAGNWKAFGLIAGGGVVLGTGGAVKNAAEIGLDASTTFGHPGKTYSGKLANMITDTSSPGFDAAMSAFDGATAKEQKNVARQMGVLNPMGRVDGDIVMALHDLRRG